MGVWSQAAQSDGDWEFELRDPNGYILKLRGDSHLVNGGAA
jgi:hypothetical protein